MAKLLYKIIFGGGFWCFMIGCSCLNFNSSIILTSANRSSDYKQVEIGVKHKAPQKKIQWHSEENGLCGAVNCKLLIRSNNVMENLF